jgi:holo-[acyl-carrier protein] synthase
MILAIGTDIVNISRIEQAIDRYGQRFVGRIYTESEQDYCNAASGQRRIIRYANRFAAKEALYKILGTEQGISWRELEVVRGERGKPSVQLHGRAQQVAQAMVKNFLCRKEGTASLLSSLPRKRESITAIAMDTRLRGYNNKAEEAMYRFHLSLSDDMPYSVAFVVMEAVDIACVMPSV